MDNANKSTQTTYAVYQDEDDDVDVNGKVHCFKATQTVTHIDVDESSTEKVVAMLEFTPFSEIKENCVQIIDLPKHLLKFAAGASSAKHTAIKSVLKKSSDNVSAKQKIASENRVKIDDEAQTQLFVFPHVLEDDSLPTVSNDDSTQTDLDQEYGRNITFCNNILLQNIPGNEDGGDDEEEVERMAGTTSYVSTIKFVSVEDMTAPDIEVKVKNTVDGTLRKLQWQLERMVREYGQSEVELNCRSIIDDNGVVNGDCSLNTRKEVLCECQCCGAGGGAVPVLNEPINAEEENHVRINKSSNSCSMPDLNERNIRLKEKKRSKSHCRCKSDTTTCSGFVTERVMKPNNSTAQTCGLLVDQDGDYADSYLEMLNQEQTGTQTEINEVASNSSNESVTNKPPDCRCSPSIEMPWDLLTYKPKSKQKKTPCPEVETPRDVELTPSTMRLKQLTVAAMNEGELLELTEEALMDTIGDEDLTMSEVERRIMEFDKPEVHRHSVHSFHSDESVDLKTIHPRIPPRKVKSKQVFEPSCERYNEPYMDRLYQYFPDDCAAMDRCPSHIELPWQNIVLPKKCTIRKAYKPEDYEELADSNAKKPILNMNKITSRLEFRISFHSINSKNNQDQTTINSSISTAGSKKKNVPLQGSHSQPRMGCTRDEIPSKKSDLMRVLNFSDSKSKPKINPECAQKKSSSGSSSGVNQSQRIAMLLESCKKEMEPIKDGINKLRSRIRELNLPDISSFQEVPQRPGMPYPGCTGSFNAFYPPPCWNPYYPYIPSYYDTSTSQPARKSRTRSSPPKPKRIQSTSLTSSGADQSDLDSADNDCCKKCQQIMNRKSKASKIPKPIKRRESDISRTEFIGIRASRSTNTCEGCNSVPQMECGPKDVVEQSCDCTECGEDQETQHVRDGRRTFTNKIRIDLKNLLPINKYRKDMVEKSSMASTDDVGKSGASQNGPVCDKDGECD